MKLNLMSDLHLEFAPIDLPGGDTLLLAGDILVANNLKPHRTDRNATRHQSDVLDFFKEACSKYNTVIYIAGNHEHYGSVVQETHDIVRKYFSDNDLKVIVLENSCVDLNDEYMLFGSTLWTDFRENDFSACQKAQYYMNDFHRITYKNSSVERTLIPYDTIEFNQMARSALEFALGLNPDKKFIVMTHHLPDMDSVDAKYGNDPLNYAYANTGLKPLIKNYPQIKYWFHGHTHTSSDYMIDECRVVCNPRGYAKAYRPEDCENKEFNINLTVEI
jgi:DNA repair exonuclease SbcCD nuclease subunit